MAFEKIKESLKIVAEQSVVVFRSYESALNALNEVMKKENDLANIASYAFVNAFKPTAKALSEMTSRRYVSFLDEAMDMLFDGNDQAEVLCYFDLILERMKEGG